MDRMDSTFKKIFISISFWAKNEIRMKMKSKSLSILSILYIIILSLFFSSRILRLDR